MRLILHVGTNKTGTSTLQSTLSAHTDELARAEVLYPALPGRVEHSPLVLLFKPPHGMPRGFTSKSDDPAVLRRMGEECWDEIVGQVRASRARTCVLSSEYFFGLLGDGLRAFADRLRSEFDDVLAVAYLRAPSAQYLSGMQQIVKASSRITPPSEFRYRARERVQRHLDVFDGRVSLRAFDPAALVQGCIVADFLAAALPEVRHLDAIEVENRNESLSAEAVCVLQELRRHAWPDDDGRLSPESRHVVRVLQALDRARPRTKPRLKPGIAARITESSADDLAWMREHFGISFPPPEGAGAAVDDPVAWSSDRFVDILDVDSRAVERARYELVRALAETAPRS